jgi:hypothetical protein
MNICPYCWTIQEWKKKWKKINLNK